MDISKMDKNMQYVLKETTRRCINHMRNVEHLDVSVDEETGQFKGKIPNSITPEMWDKYYHELIRYFATQVMSEI